MKHNLSFLILVLILLILAVSSGLAGATSIAPPPPVPPVSDPGGPVVVRVYYDSVEDIGRLASFDVFEYNNTEEKYVLAAVDDAGLRSLQDMGFRAVVDSQETANFSLLSVPLTKQVESVGIESIPGYTCYRTVEETYAAAATIAANYPNLATWTDVGDSWEKSVGQPDGYDMMVLKLTNSAIGGVKPRLLITAAIHAREYTTAEMATRFAEYLVNNYGTNADVTWILDHHEVHLILQMNPDGRKEAEAGYSWRKNTNENYCGVTSSSRGADLNRNYSFYWNYCSGCSSGSPCDATYRGPSAASEPETQAVQNYMLSIFPDQREASLSSPALATATGVYIDLHSYSQLVLWPWGFTTSVAPNSAALQTLGRKFAYFNSYTPEQAVSLYGTDGTTDDFAYGNLGVAAYTFEMGTAFFQACTTFENTIYPTNLNALIYAAKVVRTPYQTPTGPEALSLAVMPSSVAIGDPATLTATINDTRYRNTNGTEPTQAVAAAEYYVDTPPWQPGAAPVAMAASDGSFNSTIEGVTTTMSTTGLSTGKHILYVRGKDANNNWGAFSAIFLTITGPANQAPTADSQSVITAEDAGLGITLTGNDPEGAPLTFSVTGGPSHGSLSGIAPDLTYIPASNYNGADGFNFVANDGQVNSAPAAVSITITPVNDAPLANAQSVTTQQDVAAAITLTGNDVDGNPLTYAVVSGPRSGTLTGTAPNLTYTPASGGTDSFTFTVDDGMMTSAPATVSITVTPVNHPPVADSQSVTTAEDIAKTITLAGSDPDNNPLIFSVASGPVHGTLSGTAPNLTYTPVTDYNGADHFTFAVNDGQTSSEPATVGIIVQAVNDAPVANAQSVTTQQNTAAAITLAGSDVDGGALTYSVTQPSHGALSGTAPNLTYTPASGYSGADSFTFKVNDGQADSAPATVSITVNPAGPKLYLGSSTAGTAGGISFADEDVLIKDTGTGAWTLFFDGSDAGLANTDVDAFERQADGSLLVSFDSDFTLTGFGAVDDSDILRFVPTSIGDTTGGTWSWYFDGSDVGLSGTAEDVDAFTLLADGRLLISTLDSVSVTGASGADEDLLAFRPTALGATTTGTWAMYFDGSDVGLSNTANEDVNGVWVDAAGKIYLTTLGAFSVTGVSGDGSDIFVCTPGSLGSTTTCAWAMYWDGSIQGFSGEDTDSLSIAQ